VGGAEQVLLSIDRGLVDGGHRSWVLACAGSRTYGSLWEAPDCSAVLDERTREEGTRTYRELLEQAIAQLRPRVVHMHGVDFERYLPRAKVPVLVTLHLPVSFYTASAWRERVHFCCVSETQKASAPECSWPVIPNGVCLNTFRPCSERGDYLLVLTRICPEKGVHLALQAAHALDLPLILAGHVYPYPEHQRYFREQVEPLLDARRRLVPPVGGREKARLLGAARCLLVPSLVDETSSLVSMEALACGTPVVALRRGALPEVVEDGVSGFVVGAPSELTAAVREVGRISRSACRERAERRFSARLMRERYLRLYGELAR
jgi:glycosyltransferase involved in cell wall biosynthesis